MHTKFVFSVFRILKHVLDHCTVVEANTIGQFQLHFFFAWLCNIFLQNSQSIFGICSNCFPKYLWIIFRDVVTVKVTFWWLFHAHALCCRAEHCTTTPFSLCVIWRFCFVLVAAHRQNHFLGLLDFAWTSTAPLNWIFYEILDSGNCELEALWYLFMGLPCFIGIN